MDKANVVSRRKRLEVALNTLPYNHKQLGYTREQKIVLDIVRLLSGNEKCKNETTASESATNQAHTPTLKEILAKYYPKKYGDNNHALDSDIFAMEALREIELADLSDGSTWEDLSDNTTVFSERINLLTQAATTLSMTRRRLQEEYELENAEQKAEYESRILMEQHIGLIIVARLHLLQNWEVNKRKALHLLTVQIDRLQNIEDELPLVEETNKSDSAKDEVFDEFCDGTEEHNTSTPKSLIILSDSDDETEINNTHLMAKHQIAQSTPEAKRIKADLDTEAEINQKFKFEPDENGMVTIGPNGTQLSYNVIKQINWNLAGASVTRKLLCEVFDRNTLAFHTLTGKPSPAFYGCSMPVKTQLDPLKVADIVHLITSKYDMTTRDVRTAITTKCSDENKMLRARMHRLNKHNKPRKLIT